MRKLACLLACLLCSGNLSASAQVVGGVTGGIVVSGPGDTVFTSSQPARDPRQPPATGTAAIHGRVVDAESGLAVRRAAVRLGSNGSREGWSTTTDADGQYAFEALPAGRYSISASKTGYINWSYGQKAANTPAPPLDLADGQRIERADLSMPRGGVITGRVLDEFGEPLAEVMISTLRNQFTSVGRQPVPMGRSSQSNDIGEFRLYGLPPGDYLISASAMRFTSPFDSSTDRTGYAPSYFPGTANPAEAQTIRVAPGQTISGITISLIPARTATVSGVVVDEKGELARNGMVSVRTAVGVGFMNPSGPVRPDGSFTVSGLAPGTYVLVSNPMSMMMGAISGSVAGAPAPMRVTPSVATITVNGEDIDGVRLEPARRALLNGRVVVDPAGTASLRPESVRFQAMPAAPGAQMFNLGPVEFAQLQSDGSLRIEAMPGPSIIRAMGLPPGWVVSRITAGGLDVTDRIDIPAAGIDDLVIELSSRAPTVTGRVANARGEATSDFVALIFPQEEDQWPTTGTTRQAIGQPDREGRFTIRSVRPGNYYLAAVERLENGQSYDPAFLESIRTSAVRVTLNEGDTQTIDLKLVVLPQQP